MDALELGNDSGSLLACRTRRLSPQARGGFLSWTRHLGLDQQGLEAALDSKEDSDRGRVRREIEQSFSHPPPCLPHWQRVLSWILTTWTGNRSNRRCQQPMETRRTAGALPESQRICRRQHSMTRPSAESGFDLRTSTAKSTLSEAKDLNISSSFSHSNDRGSCRSAWGLA